LGLDPHNEEHDYFGKTGIRQRKVGNIDEIDEDGDNKPTDVNDNSSGEENHSLLKKKKNAPEAMPRCYCLRRWFGCIISRERRHIRLDGSCKPRSYPTNR